MEYPDLQAEKTYVLPKPIPTEFTRLFVKRIVLNAAPGKATTVSAVMAPYHAGVEVMMPEQEMVLSLPDCNAVADQYPKTVGTALTNLVSTLGILYLKQAHAAALEADPTNADVKKKLADVEKVLENGLRQHLEDK